jgi:hypothetical protein
MLSLARKEKTVSISQRSVGRVVPVVLLLILASASFVLQVRGLEPTSQPPSAVPREPEPALAPESLGSCVVRGIPVCQLCRPCPENCIQLCSFPDICQCGCVGCIDDGGQALGTTEPLATPEPQATYTLPSCSIYRGNACTQEQGLRRCMLAPGEPGICWCPDGTWHCG